MRARKKERMKASDPDKDRGRLEFRFNKIKVRDYKKVPHK